MSNIKSKNLYSTDQLHNDKMENGFRNTPIGITNLIMNNDEDDITGSDNAVFGFGHTVETDKNIVGGAYNEVINDIPEGQSGDRDKNAVFGAENIIVGCNNLVGGGGNRVEGDDNIVGGYYNNFVTPTKNSENFVSGARNEIIASDYSAIFGNLNTVGYADSINTYNVEKSLICGNQNNIYDASGNAIVGTGNKGHTIYNSAIFGNINELLKNVYGSLIFGQAHGQVIGSDAPEFPTKFGNGVRYSFVGGMYEKIEPNYEINNSFVMGIDNTLGTSASEGGAMYQDFIFGTGNTMFDGVNNVFIGDGNKTLSGVTSDAVPSRNFLFGFGNQLSAGDDNVMFGVSNKAQSPYTSMNYMFGGNNAFSGGNGNKTDVSNNVAFGSSNTINGSSIKNVAIFGTQNNIAGLNVKHSFVQGVSNLITPNAEHAFVSGGNNKVSTFGGAAAKFNTIFGSGNEASYIQNQAAAIDSYNTIFGKGLKVKGEHNFVVGTGDNDQTTPTQSVVGSNNVIFGIMNNITSDTLDNSKLNLIQGMYNNVNGMNNTVFGNENTVYSHNATILGSNITANNNGLFIGSYNETTNPSNYINYITVADGNSNSGFNIFELSTNGQYMPVTRNSKSKTVGLSMLMDSGAYIGYKRDESNIPDVVLPNTDLIKNYLCSVNTVASANSGVNLKLNVFVNRYGQTKYSKYLVTVTNENLTPQAFIVEYSSIEGATTVRTIRATDITTNNNISCTYGTESTSVKNADFVEITIDGVDFPSSTITSDVSVILMQ